MNVHSLVPLIATIAYIPLFLILVANRPWQRNKQLFAALLLALMMWSLGDFLFRSDYLTSEKVLVAKVTLCIFTLAFTQFHYFLRTFYETGKPGIRLVYIYTAVALVLILLFLPESVQIGENVVPVYGIWIYPLAVFYLSVIGVDVYMLIKKLRVTTDPTVHNQLVYLMTGLMIMVVFTSLSLGGIGREFPLAHIGNLFFAILLTYVVIRHKLLDLRFVLRESLTFLAMAATGFAIYLIFYTLVHAILKIEAVEPELVLGAVAALIVAFAIYMIRNRTRALINKLFYGRSYAYRQELNNFVRNRINGIINLDDLGNELLTLLSASLRIQRAYLLLPDQETYDYHIRFAIPSLEEKPSFMISNDSPLLQWLKRTNSYLPREKIDIEPEFKGLWDKERENIHNLKLEMLFPIISRNNLVGILALGEKLNKGRYRLEDISLAERTLKDIATTLEKEYLQDQLRCREQELSLINRLTGVITSSLDIQEVYNAFVSELKEVVEANYTAICTIEDNMVYFAAISTDVGSAWHIGQNIPIANTATEWVYLNKRYYYENDLLRNRRFSTGDEYIKRGIRSILYLPMINKGEVIGVLIIGSKKPDCYSLEQSVLLEHLAAQIAAPVENSRLFAKTEQIARIDPITGLFNRRHFDERLRSEIDRHSRYGDVLSILLLDLDNFKNYNDTYGHIAGDRLLAQAGNGISGSIRSSDLAFRYGGDEFAVILPNSSAIDAFNVAERIREKIAFEMASRQLDISVSIGVASWPGDGSTLDELCNAADLALYYAKRTGQNRTSIASRTLLSLNYSSVSKNIESEALNTIYALAATLEARDKYTYGHSRRVSRYAVAVAEAMQLPPEQVAVISAAALLHDIGKVGIPDNVLNKKGKLLPEEWDLFKQHPRLSATILGHVPNLSACLGAVRYHHERWDGEGYPSGLKGEAIPIEARILCVADAFEAMVSDRPYRGPLTFKQAIAELKRCAGSQFDPDIVKFFIPVALSSSPDDIELEMQHINDEEA